MNLEQCELCTCKAKLTKHHLIPKVRCKNKYQKLKNDDNNFIWICNECHSHIHATYSENELRDNYSSKDLLLQSEKIQKFIKWRKKHQDFSGGSKMSNRRK